MKLVSRVLAMRLGGTDMKMALVALAAQSSDDQSLRATINSDDVELAFKASEMNRRQFQEQLRILRDRRLIGITTKADLVGKRQIVSIEINLSSAATDDEQAEIVGDLTPSQMMWSEALNYFRSVGTAEVKARGLIGRLLKTAKGDPFKVRDAVRGARRAEPHDPFLWMTKAITKSVGGTDGNGITGALDRLADRATGAETV